MSANNDPFNDEEVGDLEFSIEQAIDDLFVPIAGQDDSDNNTDDEANDQASSEFSDNSLSEATEAIDDIGGPTIENRPAEAEVSSDFLEPINASLLSLDWEINIENIRALQQETNQLAKILRSDRHSMIIIKMIMIVLKYLLSNKENSSPVSIKLLHTSIQALELIHNPAEGQNGHNQALFVELKNEFRSLKNEILAPGGSLESATIDKIPSDKNSAAASSSSPPSIMVKNIQGLTMQMVDILEIMQKEINRLSFIDKFFDKNPALAEAKEYFEEIKKDFSGKINDVLSIDNNLIDMIKQLNKKIIDIEENNALSSDPLNLEEMSPTEEISLMEDIQTEEISIDDLNEPLPDQGAVEAAPSPQKEKADSLAIYISQIENHKIGIPESFVANTFELAPKKAQKLNERGFVTLPDFQKRFKSIKHGLNNNLNGLSTKVLKRIKFPIIKLNRNAPGFDDLEASDSQIKGIVFLSNGLQHAALFTNEVMDKKPQTIEQYSETTTFNEIKGTATIGEDSDINIIDVEYILSYVV